MTFRQFMQLDELMGQYGSVKIQDGPLDLIKQCKPVKGKGSSVSRMFNAGKNKNPARPARITTVNGPMTKPTLLK